jgi:hypothetical protein
MYAAAVATATGAALCWTLVYKVIQLGVKFFCLAFGGHDEMNSVDCLKPHLGLAPLLLAELVRHGHLTVLQPGPSYSAADLSSGVKQVLRGGHVVNKKIYGLPAKKSGRGIISRFIPVCFNHLQWRNKQFTLDVADRL